jgi:hypothetical protein
MGRFLSLFRAGDGAIVSRIEEDKRLRAANGCAQPLCRVNERERRERDCSKGGKAVIFCGAMRGSLSGGEEGIRRFLRSRNDKMVLRVNEPCVIVNFMRFSQGTSRIPMVCRSILPLLGKADLSIGQSFGRRFLDVLLQQLWDQLG